MSDILVNLKSINISSDIHTPDGLREWLQSALTLREQATKEDQILIDKAIGAQWLHELPSDLRNDGIDVLNELLGSVTETISVLANSCFSNRLEVLNAFEGRSDIQYHKRKITKVALSYKGIANGGAYRIVSLVCNLLASSERYRVYLLTDDEPNEDDYPLDSRVERIVLPHQSSFPKDDYRIRAAAINSFLDQYEPDVVISSSSVEPIAVFDMLTIKSHKTHPAYCIHMHNSIGRMFALWFSRVAEINQKLALSDGIITLAKSDQYYWSHYNKNTVYIPNSCHVQANVAPRATFSHNILWLARVSNIKRPCDIPPIVKLVREVIPDATCTVVGAEDSAELKLLEKKIFEYGLEDAITLAGFHKDVDSFYQSAGVLLGTSKFECFPTTFSEAAAYGVPTVFYELPWIEYYHIFEGYTSVPQEDVYAAARAIIKLFSDESYWQQCSDQEYESYQRYISSDSTKMWIDFLAKLSDNTNANDDFQSVDSPDRLMNRVIFDEIIFLHDIELSRVVHMNSTYYHSNKSKDARIQQLCSKLEQLKKENAQLKEQLLQFQKEV